MEVKPGQIQGLITIIYKLRITNSLFMYLIQIMLLLEHRIVSHFILKTEELVGI